jgi:fatty acid desaturase
MSNLLHKAWGYLQQADDYWDEKTQPIEGKSHTDKLKSLTAYFKLDTDEQNDLASVDDEDDGQDYIKRRIADINRNASHRTAFLVNAAIQFLIVNLASLSLLSFIPDLWFKILLIGANLFVAFIAWRRIKSSRNKILKGPSDEPEWSFFGMFRSNRRKHNQHIKELAEPHKIRMRDERLFSIMYLVNALTIFFASQLILSGYLPAFIRGVINFPLFILTIPLAIANAYWAFRANNQVVKAATERGSTLDKLKL